MRRTIFLGAGGLAILLVGFFSASVPMASAGVVFLAAITADALRFIFVDARAPLTDLIRTAKPNPCWTAETMTIDLRQDPLATKVRADSSPLEETVPASLVAYVVMKPPEDTWVKDVSLSYELTPPHRGQWTLGPTSAVRFSYLGLFWTKVLGVSVCEVTAWPEITPVDVQGWALDRVENLGKTGYVQPHHDNTTVRAYNPGDDLRRVHWRSSARQGELMTRAEEPLESDHAWVGLMIPLGTESALRELAISLAASWIVEMDQAGFAVDLACGGELHRGRPDTHLTRLAIVTNLEASQALPPASPEGVSLLIATQPASRSARNHLVSPPPGRSHRFAGAVG
ncbi:MAG: DUF58 domain-containing protein, partial [Propionibacteriaceae bacterium]|nr:DUF58 domain-containing protein [Propionibacteriaceae bacterium]